tara:strand:+ start:71 stop:337 length:267 start_codon:yes stop_codon:yes gene_type:complete
MRFLVRYFILIVYTGSSAGIFATEELSPFLGSVFEAKGGDNLVEISKDDAHAVVLMDISATSFNLLETGENLIIATNDGNKYILDISA